MNDNLKPCLTETDLTEFEAALAELTDTERHVFFRLMELHPIEEVLEIIDAMEDECSAAKTYFADFNPYTKCESIPPENQNRSFQISEDGHICVKNPSACWMPELTLRRQIGGTIYTVSGSYEGAGMLDQKLLRIMVQNAENMEDSK